VTPEQYNRVGQLYHQALELEGAERAEFLERECAGDELLRREVQSLIASHEEQEIFLAAPAIAVAAKQMVDEDALSADQQIGHYRILSLLGKGGMGEVYLAQDTKLNRKVAIKALPSQFTQDPERVRRFEREARAASALNHPNIVAIYEIGQEDGRHYIVTEFVDGETLRQRCKRAKVTLSEVLDIAIQVAGALAAAHEAGVVHRDIKPDNVMLRRDGYVKVLDFGLAKLLEKAPESPPGNEGAKPIDTTTPGMVVGTASYMSPEQARGQKVDARSDIFSLGVVLYELVAGKAPFEGVNAFEVISAILEREPQPLGQHRAEAPAELERIISRALEKDRDLRHQTASDLRAELKRLQRELDSGSTATVSGEPTSADSRSGWRRWRMKAVLALGGLAVLAVAWFLLLRFGDRPAADLYGGGASQESRSTAQAQRAIGVQPSAGTDKLVGVRWSDKKYFFFRGGEYYRYDVEADRMDADHPQPIADNWKGVWAEGVDTIIISPWDNGKAYLFKGMEYIQYDTADRRPDVGYPKPIVGNWQGIWPDGIDAAIVWNNGKIYFFKGSEYIRFDIQSKRSDPGYPTPIADSWPGVWSSNIDTIFTNHWPPHSSGKAYFFKDGQYLRYDMASNKVDAGYPKTISRYWIGLP
jgi:serine/threonine protein kinase